MMDKKEVIKLALRVYDAENELQDYIVRNGESLGVDPVGKTQYGREMNLLKIAGNTNRSNIELLSQSK